MSGLYHGRMVILSLFIFLVYIVVPNHYLSFDRVLIEHGEWWRLISGSITHTNIWHVAFNVVSLNLIFILYNEHFNHVRFVLMILLLCFVVGVGILFLCPQTMWFMGLSGALHGLFVCGAMQDFRQGHWIYGLIAFIGVAIKLSLDYSSAGHSVVSELIGARVHIESHLLGAAAGVLLNICHTFDTPIASCEK